MPDKPDAVRDPRFKLVPVEPTQEMVNRGYGEITTRIELDDRDMRLAYRAAIKAAPALTDAEIDGLCRKMWPEKAYWSALYDFPRQHAVTVSAFTITQEKRNADRTRMRAFLALITRADDPAQKEE